MKKTFSELLNFVNLLNANIGENPETIAQKKLILIGEKVEPYIKDFNNERDGILLNNALEIDGRLVYKEDGKSYEYNKAGEAAKNKELGELLDSEFDFTPIQINNPQHLEKYWFLKEWTTGITFPFVEPVEI